MRELRGVERLSCRDCTLERTLAYFDLDEKQLVGFEHSDITCSVF